MLLGLVVIQLFSFSLLEAFHFVDLAICLFSCEMGPKKASGGKGAGGGGGKDKEEKKEAKGGTSVNVRVMVQ